MQQQNKAAESAIRKLEEFYKGLDPDEQRVISLIVSSSLQRAARAQVERDWLKDGESLLELISPRHAPELVATMGKGAAGQLAARVPAGQIADVDGPGGIKPGKRSTT